MRPDDSHDDGGHGDHGDHGDDSMGATQTSGQHGMPMYWSSTPFSGSLLFQGLDISSTRAYVAFVFALSFVCILREYLSVFRLEVELLNGEAAVASSPTGIGLHGADSSLVKQAGPRRCCGLISAPLLASLLYGVNMALAYVIMLVVMSYDCWLFMVVLVSSVSAHYLLRRPPPAARAAHASRVMQLSSQSPLARLSQQQQEREARVLDPDMDEEQHGLTEDAGGAPSLANRPGVPFPAVFPGSVRAQRTPNPAQLRAATLHIAANRECCES